MRSRHPVERDLVLVGGGHAHVAVLYMLAMRPVRGLRLSVVARDVVTPYSGMLPGLIAGHYGHAQAHIDLAPLARLAGARLYHVPAIGIDPEARLVRLDGRPSLPYDLLSVDVGSVPSRTAIVGADHAIAVKPVDRFLLRLDALEREVLARDGAMQVVVVGGGAGGVELALSLEHRLRAVLAERGVGHDALGVTIVSRDRRIVASHADGVRRRLEGAIARRGLGLVTGDAVVAIEPERVRLASGRELAADATILTTEAAAAPWLAASGLAVDERGFMRVDACLRSVSHPEVHGAGDCIAFEPRPLPKSGVFAVREGPVLAENLRRAAEGRAPARYRPQHRSLALISMGTPHAVASYGGLAVGGAAMWRLKDWIDRRWMRRYQVLPPMAAGPDDAPMRCAGCGSKVSAEVLRRAIARVPRARGEGVRVGLDAPDDAAVIDVPAGQVLVQSVDHFRAFVEDPWLLGRITANHCLGDIHAMGARPHSALASVTLGFASPQKLGEDLEAVLAGVVATLSDAGAVLVGGHTAEGPETALGLTVNGFGDPGELLTKSGLRPGDALVLTKPIGSGVVLAADMRARAPGPVVGAALDAMQISNGPAAAVLREHGARACTDVTGFGLLGHLGEMLDASGCAARLDPAAVPLLPGAAALAEAGFESTLAPANRAAAARVGGGVPPGPAAALLFDPQTAGGLLAGIPAERSLDCLAALRDLGYESAAVVGEVVDAAPPSRGTVRLAAA